MYYTLKMIMSPFPCYCKIPLEEGPLEVPQTHYIFPKYHMYKENNERKLCGILRDQEEKCIFRIQKLITHIFISYN